MYHLVSSYSFTITNDVNNRSRQKAVIKYVCGRSRQFITDLFNILGLDRYTGYIDDFYNFLFYFVYAGIYDRMKTSRKTMSYISSLCERNVICC